VSDPKAVLEQTLRNFTCLTQGDIIEIGYNTIVFGLLVMETRTTSQNGPPCEYHLQGCLSYTNRIIASRVVTPSMTAGISVFNTDLEVEFVTPKGYKEPPRVAPKPVEAMASR
jgi:ubiquitin fusion degradation protein 1